jgi:branched-chain amino acid transport system permease protein
MITELLVHVLNGLSLGGIYVLMAIGLSLIFGIMHVINFAHASLWMLGAYFSLTIIGATVTIPIFGPITGTFWLALLVVPFLVGVVGWGMETTFRPIYGRNPLYHILLTFGFTLIIADVVRGYWGGGFQNVAAPEMLRGPVDLGAVIFPRYRLFVIGCAVLLSGAVWAILKYTNFGLIMRAGSQNRMMTRSLGVSISRYYTLVFVFGAILAGVAGVLAAPIYPLTPDVWTRALIISFVIVIVGGLGSFKGAVTIGFLAGIVENLGSVYTPQLSGYLIYIMLFAVLLVRPHGIFGREGYEEETAEVSFSGKLPVIGARSRIFQAAVVVLLLFPPLVTTFLSSWYVGIMVQAIALAMLAMSLDLVTGYTGLISFGHAMFIGIGAYVTAIVLLNVTGTLPIAIAVAVLLAAAIAWATGYLGVRVSGVYFAMLTLAIAEMFHEASIGLEALTGGSDGLSFVMPSVPLLDLTDATTLYYLSLLTLVGLYLLAVRILDSPFGRALRGIRDSEKRMRALGYDVNKYKRRAFTLSGIYGGFAGVVYALYFTFIGTGVLHWTMSGDAIVMMILGGMGTLYGPILGAFAFVGLKQIIPIYVELWRLVLGVLFVLSIIFLPRGLVQLPEKIRELPENLRRLSRTVRRKLPFSKRSETLPEGENVENE